MDSQEQIDAFAIELDNLINRFRSEFDLSVAAAIGVLEIAKLEIYTQDVVEASQEDNEL
jgi:hypothetical protein